MTAPIRFLGVLPLAILAEWKHLHGRPLAVIRERAGHGVPRPAGRAGNIRIPIAAISRVFEFFRAVPANPKVCGEDRRRRLAAAFRRAEVFRRNVCALLACQLLHKLGGLGIFDFAHEKKESVLAPLRLYFYHAAFIFHRAHNFQILRQAAHPRTESHPLHPPRGGDDA